MASRDDRDNVIKNVLPNGLTVLFKEDHSNPVVTVNAWFKVGSANETEAESGLAHFQEHMVFKGTERHGVGEIANLVRAAGGNLNAATSYSYTMYYVVLPSRAFSLALDIQADAMMNSTFAPEEFKKERLVVIDEARMYDDTPDAYTFYRTMELGYEVHNYRRPIAGYERVVRHFTRDQLVAFYRRYYRPSNAVLVVVGDVSREAAIAEIEKVYGTWEGAPVNVNDSPAEPPQAGFRFNAPRGTIDHAYLGIGFHVPSILDADYPALEMLSTLLSAGRSSRLYRKVVEEKQLATTAGADLLAEKWPGFFMLFASAPAAKWAGMRDAVFEELARFQNEAVGEDELVKARRQVEKSMYAELETVEGQASNLGYYEVLGDYRLAEQHREAIRTVTPAEVMAVARKYFRVENCSMVSYLPKDTGIADPLREEVEAVVARYLSPSADVPEVSSVRPASKMKSSSARVARGANGGVSLSTIGGGVRVLVKRRSTVPLISMLTILGGGTRLEAAGRSGLSTLASRALVKGTASFDAEAIVGTIEGLGGSIESFSSFDVSGLYVNVLSEHLADAVPVYKDVLRHPAFAPDTIDHEKQMLLKELARRHDHPLYYSVDKLFAGVFGDHPYAHPFVGDASQLEALTPEHCAEWYRGVLTPENLTMVFVGDITETEAQSIAEELLGDLEPGTVPLPDKAAPASAVDPGVHEFERPSLKQAIGLVGFAAPPMMTREAIGLGVLNGIMTGLGGRLFVELRDKRSLGYMAGSAFMPFKERSIFYAYSNPGADGLAEAVDVITTELKRVATEPVRDDELQRSKEWLIGSQAMKLQRNLSQAIEYGLYESLGFGWDVVEKTADIIASVTQDDIVKAAADVFRPERAVCIKLIPEREPQPAAE